ncbi:hypothetical protein M5K25_018709 [Dendrobium thyrsiflorum]|uniref:DUF4283 domain-containing protein n=1 Tax=Dendrobium thyrsiflorum TaxID=117978 RepID=A0ABD0UQX4_DENTH
MAGGAASSSLPLSSPPPSPPPPQQQSSSLPLKVPPSLASSPGGAPMPRVWSNLFDPIISPSGNLNLSFCPSEPDIIPFSGEKLTKGAADWKFCLVGYSVGKRPFYEALLAAVKKAWQLKGSLQLLSLSDGFFLFRFSCAEDFEAVWSRGVWFILGKPFILQKWHPKFRPRRENLTSMPIWIKIHDLPLACWNSEGISRIASKVGIPLAADSLTSQRTCLTYARVCVQVDCEAKYPEEISVSLDGDVISLKVQYEWRPYPCMHCKSLVHTSNSCSLKPESSSGLTDKAPLTHNRGRSTSRNPRGNNSKGVIPSKSPGPSRARPPVPAPNLKLSLPSNDNEFPLHFQPHSPTHQLLAPTDPLVNIPQATDIPLVSIANSIPNLNSPTEETSSSTCKPPILADSSAACIISNNKFDVLQSEETQTSLIGELSSLDVVKKDKLKGIATLTSNSSVPKKHTRGKQVMDLQSVGCPFTWFNNRLDNPIHIKLDRVLVNENWLNTFPNSFCSVQPPSCSDHCPLIVKSGDTYNSRHRFLFKNYWTRMDNYWDTMLEIFSVSPCGNPIIDFCNKLKKFRGEIKNFDWANSNVIQSHLDKLHKSQADCLDRIAADPLNPILNATLKVTPSAPISFYWDHWCPVVEFLDHCHAYLNAPVRDFIIENKWVLPSVLDPNIARIIQEIPISDDSLPCLIWDNQPGNFGAYVKVYYVDSPTCLWANHLWFKGGALRYSVYGWMCLAGGLKTTEALSLRNIFIEPLCPLCRIDRESTKHIFFECNFSYNIITQLIPQATTFYLRPNASQFLDWLDDLNVNSDYIRLYKLITCCAIYLIWRERNDRRFGGISNCSTTVLKKIQASVCAKVFKWKNGVDLLDHF